MYKSGGIIEQVKDFSSYIERADFLKSQLLKTKADFEKKRNDIEPNKKINIQIGDKQTGKVFTIQSNQANATHGDIFKNHLTTFQTAIKAEIKKIEDFVLVEKKVLEYKTETATAKQLAYLYQCKFDFKINIKTNHTLNNENYTYNPNPDKWGVQLAEQIINELKQATPQNTGNPRPKHTAGNRPLSLNPRFDNKKDSVKRIYHGFKPFINADLDQWENLFSNEIKEFKKPMILRTGFYMKDLRLLFKLLSDKGLVNRRIWTILERCKAFEYEGEIITSAQYKEAKKGNFPNTQHAETIQEIIKEIE